MAQIGAVFVFCSSCKILCFASSVHPKNATEQRKTTVPLLEGQLLRHQRVHWVFYPLPNFAGVNMGALARLFSLPSNSSNNQLYICF